jgi:hypothetical protein
LDVLGVIAKHLIDDNAYGTCAALNVTSKEVELETSPTLWKTCVLPGGKAFETLPPSARFEETSTLSGDHVAALEENMGKQWEDIRNAKNAKWIE